MMKILSYNILSGGLDSYQDKSMIPRRLDQLRVMVAEVGADIVSLIDTFRWNEIMDDSKLKTLFDYPYVYSIVLNDQRLIDIGCDNGITVLSKVEIQFEQIRLYNRNAIKSSFLIEEKKVDLFSTYLDDASEDTRMAEVKVLFDIIDQNKASLIMGDLNTIDKGDLSKTESDLMHFLAKFPTLKNLEPVLREMERGEVTATIKSWGFADADESKKRRTIPSKLFTVPTIKPILRLDYAFYNKYVKKVGFEVLRGKKFDNLSDHYPILLEIE